MLLQIPLDIPDVKIENLDATPKKGYVITVSSELKGTTCQHCGKPIDKFYGYKQRDYVAAFVNIGNTCLD